MRRRRTLLSILFHVGGGRAPKAGKATPKEPEGRREGKGAGQARRPGELGTRLRASAERSEPVPVTRYRVGLGL